MRTGLTSSPGGGGVNCTGLTVPGAATVAPTWTACLGLPKRGLACGCDAGTLVLMDVGLPAQAVHALGLPYRTPFTDQYMVALHPAPPA